MNTQSHFNHIQLNVSSAKSFNFYKDLLDYLGYKIIHQEERTIGFANGPFSIWVAETEEKYKKNYFHRKNTGINHLAFRVDSKENVDKFYKEFLKHRSIGTLYDSPKEFPYAEGYYSVFFEDPDRIKLEVLYMS